MNAFEFSLEAYKSCLNMVPYYLQKENVEFVDKLESRLGRAPPFEYMMDENPSPFLVAAFLGALKAEGFDVTPKNPDLKPGAKYVELLCTPNEYGSTREGSLARKFREAREQALKNLPNFHLNQLVKTFDRNVKANSWNLRYTTNEMTLYLEKEDFNDAVAMFAFKQIIKARGFDITSTYHTRDGDGRMCVKPNQESVDRAMKTLLEKMNVGHQEKFVN